MSAMLKIMVLRINYYTIIIYMPHIYTVYIYTSNHIIFFLL